MEDIIYKIVTTVNKYMSDYILIVLLIGIGLYFTIKTNFVQIRGLKNLFKKSFNKDHAKKEEHGINPFQALMTAVAGQVGTGNIVGACGAILLGGPGAIFWMWIIAFFGLATIYAEAVMAQKTRVVTSDGVAGGPVYYIKKAFPNKFGDALAKFFAIAIVIALGWFGSMTLSNSIAEACQTAFKIPSWVISLVICTLTALVVIGGIKRIAKTAQVLVPIMGVLYLAGGLILLIVNYNKVPEAFGLIFKYAFMPQAIIGGGFGAALKAAISQGAKRGLFSNEAGMGSTPHVHALSDVAKPHDEGQVAMMGMIIDTFVVLTMTALVVITTFYTKGGALEFGVVEGINKGNMAQIAFGNVFGANIGNIFVAICLTFFAFSSIFGWNLYGRLNFEYLFGKKNSIIYLIISLIFVFLGGLFSNDLVWELSDFFNQLMVIPNAIALVALGNIVAKEAKEGYKEDIVDKNIDKVERKEKRESKESK